MSDGTKIEWTDATWNVVNGCSVTSPGCTNCYAMRLAGTRLKQHPSRDGLTIDTKAGPVWTGETRFNDKVLLDPLRWKRPRRIFVCAHGDLFHDSVPDEWIDRVFAVMALAGQHQFQVLTKRSARMRAYLTDRSTARCDGRGSAMVSLWDVLKVPNEERIMEGFPWPLPNVWLGVSVEDQARADERIPDLLATPAAVRWLSCEPLLGPVDLEFIDLTFSELQYAERSGLVSVSALDGLHFDSEGEVGGVFGNPDPHIDWVVAGGESGPGARPMHPDWARSLRDQCAAAGVPFLFKQWGEWAPDDGAGGLDGLDRVITALAMTWADGAWHRLPRLISDREVSEYDVYRIGKKHAGRLLDDVQHDGFPS